MTGMKIVTKLFIILVVIIVNAISPCAPAISDRRLCYDQQCSVPISMATTVLTYGSNDPDVMSFKSNVEVTVFSKNAGKRDDLWGVEINGKRGYVPWKMLKEKKVYKKTLIHEVPTEDIVANIPEDSPEKQEAKKEKHVPKAEVTLEKIDAKPVEKTNIITKEASLPSVPSPEQVLPSYEIHDGTTIPLAQNEEPAKPSYATQIPQGIQNTEQQPILSIHPSIASTFTLKIDEISVDESVDDAEKYLEAAGLKEQTSSEKIVEKATTELPIEPFKQDTSFVDANHTSEANSLDSTRNLDANADSKTVDAKKQANFSSSEESVEKAMENANNITNDIINTESMSNISTASLDNQILNEIVNKASEEPHLSDKIQNTTVEISTEAGDTELSAHNAKTENIAVNQDNSAPVLDNNNNYSENATAEVADNPPAADHALKNNNNSPENTTAVVADNSRVVDHASATKDLADTEEAEEDSFDDEELDDEAEEDDETEEDDEDDDISESEAKLKQFKDNLPVEQQPAIEKPVEAKPADEMPPSNVMAPFFNRLTAIPGIVKEIVEKTMSLDNSEIKAIGNEENAIAIESEVKNSNINEILESNESNSHPVDFSIDNNDLNVSDNETDHSKPAADSKRDTANQEIDHFQDKFVNISNNVNIESSSVTTADSIETKTSEILTAEESAQPGIYKQDEIAGFSQNNLAIDETSSFNGFPANRNLLNVRSGLQSDDREYDSMKQDDKILEYQTVLAFNDTKFADDSLVNSSDSKESMENSDAESDEDKVQSLGNENLPETVEISTADNSPIEEAISIETFDSCQLDDNCEEPKSNEENHNFLHEEEEEERNEEEAGIMNYFAINRKYWETLTYLVVTGFTTLLFSLGYYYIENKRRDGQLIAKINLLEKELLVASKECMVLDDTLKSTKSKLDSIEDESFGSNEMVVSLKADLEASKAAKSELEKQVTMLEKELESATEAGLELERMLREILSSNNQDNPLVQSVEDLQTRLNAQQAANEALTNSLNLKAQENETLNADLNSMTLKCEQLEVEVTRVTEELKHQNNVKNHLEQSLMDKVVQLERQVKDITAERINLRKELTGREMELKDLLEVVNQMNINNLDFEKLYNVSRVKAEASQLLEERNELQIRLNEVEGAHQLLEEHVKIINEEVSSLGEQCKSAEKAKRDAETRVEVLSNFFKEKEAQRQKEEAVWLEKQGEVSSTVERLHTMQNEIHNYKQQIEMLKREILDQEREYKNQIANLETKSHEHWVIARQNERRLEESKAEAGQLRNRLTLIEKNLNDTDPEAKLHRLEANGETATSPQLFIGAEASSSPIMFTGSSGVPFPPPPSYLYGPPPPPFMPPPSHVSPGIPPYEVGQRPPPLGGRLSSPPPLPGSNSARYENSRSPPLPLSPSMLPPFGPPHRVYPPSFANDRIHPPPPPPPPHSSMLPPPLPSSTQPWGNETLPPLRNSGFHAHQQHQRIQQRSRNHKGSLHSSRESLDKNV